jgi:hypothetical protein
MLVMLAGLWWTTRVVLFSVWYLVAEGVCLNSVNCDVG